MKSQQNSYFTLSDDCLLKVLHLEKKPFQHAIFSLARQDKHENPTLDHPYEFSLVTSKDQLHIFKESGLKLFLLKVPFESISENLGGILQGVCTIKLHSCSLNVCQDFIAKVFQNGRNLESLRKLKFINCEIDDRFINTLLKSQEILKKIEYLSLRACARITELGIRDICKSNVFEKLTGLDLSYMNLHEEALFLLAYSDLIKKITKLRLLELKATNFSKGLRELFTPGQIPKLENLYFSEDSMNEDCKSFNKYGFQYISQGLKRLHFQARLEPKEIITWHDVKNYHFKNLKSLVLKGCELTPSFFKTLEIARCLSQIEELDFSFCFYSKETLQSFEKLLLSSRLTLLKSLNLSNSNIKDSTLTLISETRYLSSLENLYLAFCKEIGNEGVNRVLFSTKRTKNLKVLTLHHTNISDDVVYNLVYRLENANTELELKALDLTACEFIQSHCLNYIAESKLIKSIKVLKLASTAMNDYALEILCRDSSNFKELTKIDLSSCRNITSRGFQDFFEKFKGTSIRHLKIRHTNIDDEGIDRLSKSAFISVLEKLKLNGCRRITDMGISTMIFCPDFKRLRVLSLIGTAMSDKNIHELPSSKSMTSNLRTLNLMNCHQIQSLLPLFTKNTTKNSKFQFNFDWNALLNQFPHLIDDQLLEKLGEQKHSSLRHISLSGMSQMTSKGLGGLLGTDREWQYLESISLQGTRIDGEGLGVIFHKKTHQNLKNLRRLDLRNCPQISEKDLVDIFKSQAKNVPENLYVDEVIFKGLLLGNEALEHFSFVKNLDVVDLSQQSLLGKQTSAISTSECFFKLFSQEFLKMKNIRKLVLDKTNVCDRDLECLTVAKNLVEISLNGCPKITTQGLITLAKNKNFDDKFDLRCLMKLDQLINDAFLEALPESRYLSALVCLDLNANGLVSEKGFKELAKSSAVENIKKIDLSQTNIDDKTLREIAGGRFKGLERIDIADCPFVSSEGLITLIRSTSFETFDLDYLLKSPDVKAKINQGVIKAIIESFYRPRFTKVHFKGLLQAFPQDDFRDLIQKCENLEEIDIRKTDCDEGILETLVESQSRKTLRTLQMDDTIGLDGYEQLQGEIGQKYKEMNQAFKDLLEDYKRRGVYNLLRIDWEDNEFFSTPTFLKNFQKDKYKIVTSTLEKIRNEFKSLAQFKLLDREFFLCFDIEYYLFSEKSSVNDLALQFLGSKLLANLKENFPDRIEEMKIPDPQKMVGNLQHLAFSGNYNITHKGLADLVSSPIVSNLEILDLSDTKITDTAIEAICKSPHMKKLKNLFFMNSPYITSKSLHSLIAAEKTLADLNLQPIFRLFSHWVEDSVIEVLSHSTLLENISILYLNNSKITKKSFEFLSASSHAQNLKCIEISEAYLAGDDCLEVLADSTVFSQSLREINMKNTPLIGSRGILALLKSKTLNMKFDMYKIILKQKIELLTGEALQTYLESRFWLDRIKKLSLKKAMLLAAKDFLEFLEKINEKKHVFYELDFEGTNINDSVLERLAKLAIIEHVRFLNVKNCPYVSHAGVSSFFRAGSLAHLSKLQISLDPSLIRHSLIEDFTKNPKFLLNIQILDLHNNLYFDNESLKILIESPSKSLRSLDISYTNVDAKGVISLVSSENLVNLINLKLKGLPLTRESLRILCQCESFSTFFKITNVFAELDDRKLLNDDVLKSLVWNAKIMKEVITLDLSATDISSTGISSLAISMNVFNLETLDISHTEVDDIGVIALSKSVESRILKRFKKLLFTSCVRVTTIGIKFLSSTRQNLEFSLQDIIETKNVFLPNSPLKASVSMMEPNKWVFFDFSTFKKLTKNRSYISVGPDSRLRFPFTFQFKEDKDFEECLNGGLIFRNLTEISFENNQMIRDEDLWPITTCPYLRNLTKVTVNNCNISSKLLERFINSYRVLINLDIAEFLKGNEKYINDSVLIALGESHFLAKMNYLSLESNQEVTFMGLRAISESRFSFNIIEINCSQSRLDDKGLEELSNSKYLLNLRKIELKGCKNLSPTGLKFLINSTALSYQFSIDELFENLAEIHEKNILCDELLDCLAQSLRLIFMRRLRLYFNKGEISEGRLESLLSRPNVVNLREINLSNSKITSGIIGAITKSLKYLRSLRVLNLDGTKGYEPKAISNLLIELTPPYEEDFSSNSKDPKDHSRSLFNYLQKKKCEGSFKIIPKKFDLQKLIDQVRVDYDIFLKVKFCPFFYNVRHFVYTDKSINIYLLKDLVFFQQSKNIRRINIQADNIDEIACGIIAKSEVLQDLEQLELPNLQVSSLKAFIGTKIVHREFEPFSLFRSTALMLKINDEVLKGIALWENLLNSRILHFPNNKEITGIGIKNLLSTDYCCQITEIDLTGTNVDNMGLEAICYNKRIPRLQKLRLKDCKELNSESLKIVCDDTNSLSPFFIYNHPFLDLQARIDDSVIEKLVSSKAIQYITELDLSNAKVSQKSLLKLVSCQSLCHLKELSLVNTLINDEFLENVGSMSHLSCLKLLKLFDHKNPQAQTEITSRGIAHLFRANFSDYFDIKDFITQIKPFINDDICKEMGSSKLLRNLVKLDLSSSKFSSQMVLTILENTNLRHLSDLDLSNTSLDNETLEEISSRPGFRNVLTLNIEGCQGITSSHSLVEFFSRGQFLNMSFDFQRFFESILEKFDDNLMSFTSVMSILPLFNKGEQKQSSPKLNSTLIKPQFFREFLKTQFFMKKLEFLSLLSYRFIDQVALMFFDYRSDSFDISEFIFHLPLRIQNLINDTHIKKIVENFSNIKYIQLKSLPNVTFGINYLLKADSQTKFELAFKAQYIKKPRVQSIISADSLQKFLEETLSYPEFLSFIRVINLSENRYLSYFNARQEHCLPDYKIVNEDFCREVKKILMRSLKNSETYNSKTRANSVVPNSEGVSPQSNKSPGTKIYKFTDFKELRRMHYRGQKINLIDDEMQVEVLLPFIKACTHLRNLNLNGLNIGDRFLKEFSMFLSVESNLKSLVELNLENNARITAVGLKYLYTSVYKRAGKLEIFLEKELILKPERGVSSRLSSPELTCLKPNGAGGQSPGTKTQEIGDNIFKEPFLRNILKSPILEEIKDEEESQSQSPASKRSIKDPKTIRSPRGGSPSNKRDRKDSQSGIVRKDSYRFFDEYQMLMTSLMIYGVFETINRHFRRVWSNHFIAVTIFLLILFPFTLFHFYRLLLAKITAKTKKILAMEKLKNSCVVKLINQINVFLRKSLKCRCMLRKVKAEKRLDFLKGEDVNVFYFDQDVEFLNRVLSFKSLQKTDESTYHYRPTFLRLFKYFILIDFLLYYFYVIIYPTAYEVGCSDNQEPVKSVLFDVPYFCYAALSFLVEAIFLNEIANIMNCRSIFAMFSLSNLLSLIATQTARYDLYTDINFMVFLFRCDNTRDLAVASLIIIMINIFLTLYIFIKTYVSMLYKYRSSSNNEKQHQTFFLDGYTQLTFAMDYQGLGNILDRFSTKSASIVESKWAPSLIRGIYFPSAMMSRFQRMLIENIPLIIIQLIFMMRNSLIISDFTQMKTFITTILSILGSLNRVWDAKPSLFERRIFNKYYENLEENFIKDQGRGALTIYRETGHLRKGLELDGITEGLEDQDSESAHLKEKSLIDGAMRRQNRKGGTLLSLNRKQVSLLIDNDDDSHVKQRKPKGEFTINPIIAAAKKEANQPDSLTALNDKGSIFGMGTNYQSKDSDHEEATNIDMSPDNRHKIRQL